MKRRVEKHLETLPMNELLKIAKVVESKYRRAIRDGKAKFDPKLGELRAGIKDMERGQ